MGTAGWVLPGGPCDCPGWQGCESGKEQRLQVLQGSQHPLIAATFTSGSVGCPGLQVAQNIAHGGFSEGLFSPIMTWSKVSWLQPHLQLAVARASAQIQTFAPEGIDCWGGVHREQWRSGGGVVVALKAQRRLGLRVTMVTAMTVPTDSPRPHTSLLQKAHVRLREAEPSLGSCFPRCVSQLGAARGGCAAPTEPCPAPSNTAVLRQHTGWKPRPVRKPLPAPAPSQGSALSRRHLLAVPGSDPAPASPRCEALENWGARGRAEM